jgi:hypothetical protein
LRRVPEAFRSGGNSRLEHVVALALHTAVEPLADRYKVAGTEEVVVVLEPEVFLHIGASVS